MKGNCADEEIVGIKNEKAESKKEQIDEMPSSMNENAEKAKKSIKFAGWLPEVLDWIKRTELAQSSLSTSSLTFHRYCWPNLHGRVKPRICNCKLTFSRAQNNEGNWQTFLKRDDQLIPIAQIINPPEYIVGFDEIKFEFIDDKALEFLKKFLPKMDIAIRFYLFHQGFEDNQQIGPISRLIALVAQKTSNLEIFHNQPIMNSDDQNDNSEETFTDLTNFDQQFPGFIYGLRSIFLIGCTERLNDLVVKWLNMPREDDKHKTLTLYFGLRSVAFVIIDRIKEEFLQSKKPTNFIVYVYYEEEDGGVHENNKSFKIENKETGEMLEMDNKKADKVLIRYKKGGEKRVEWEEQFKREWKTKTTIVMP